MSDDAKLVKIFASDDTRIVYTTKYEYIKQCTALRNLIEGYDIYIHVHILNYYT